MLKKQIMSTRIQVRKLDFMHFQVLNDCLGKIISISSCRKGPLSAHSAEFLLAECDQSAFMTVSHWRRYSHWNLRIFPPIHYVWVFFKRESNHTTPSPPSERGAPPQEPLTIKLWEIVNEMGIEDLVFQQILLVQEEDNRWVLEPGISDNGSEEGFTLFHPVLKRESSL